MSVGFIGLGNIGKPMARHLLKLGEPVYVHDVMPGPVDELARIGAHAATLQEIGRQCRIVGLCVRDDHDVDALLHGPEGLLQQMQADTVIAVHSTVTQASILRWAGEANTKGIHLVDAPITGGASGAEAGTLAYMVGGAGGIVERCRAVFATSAQKIIHAGPTGAGIALKLCNNLMSYAAFAAMHEADALARAAGPGPALLLEVGRANGVVTPQMEAFIGNRGKLAAAGPEMLRKSFGPFASLGRKDLLAALASAEELGLELPATARLAALIEAVFLGDSGS